MSKNIRAYCQIMPDTKKSLYIDAAAIIIGQVTLAEGVSIWPCAVLRGDVNTITIGKNTNIQDLSMLHVSTPSADKPAGSPLTIGEHVTVGHSVTLHGCRIGNHVLIGMGSIVLDDAQIDDEIIIGAGSLVPPGKHLQSGYLYMGSPVKQVRELSLTEKQFLRQSAQHYIDVAQNYLEE